jgi:hypothetical protein
MLFDKSVLTRYSEFLDQQGLVIGDGHVARLANPRKAPAEDKRSHEQLVEDFLDSDREDEHESAMPPGWHLPDQRVADLEMDMGALKQRLRLEEGRRASAELLMTDRAHYVPREEYDRAERLYRELDKAYAESMALHLHRDNVEAGLNGDVTRLKTMLVKEQERLRGHLTKAYGILAGACPPLPDTDLARVMYEVCGVMVQDYDLTPEDWETLGEPWRVKWQKAAEQLRAAWSTVEAGPMPWMQMAQEWAAAKQELMDIDELIQQYAPGLERRIGPYDWMATSDAVRALFTIVRDVALTGKSIIQAGWPVIEGMMTIFGYEMQVPTVRRVDQWEAAEPKLAAQPDLSGVLAERIRQTKQRASGAGAEALWTARPEEVVNATQTTEDALRSMALEIGRLGEGLAAEGITLRPGPVHGAEVDTALQALNEYWSPKLGLATTKTLLLELVARGNSGGWPSFAQGAVQALLDGLDDDELTYKTMDGRAASAG